MTPQAFPAMEGEPDDLVPIGTEGLYLQRRYAIEVDDPDCPFLMEIHVRVVDRQPRCVDFRARQRSGGVPVTSEGLRKVRLANYVRQSVFLYAIRVTDELVQATGSSDLPAIARSVQRRPRRPMTDDFLREVAEVVRSAEGNRTTVRVMQHFDAKQATASKWIRLARDRGLLPEPASHGREGR